jgi:hypothetical protein
MILHASYNALFVLLAYYRVGEGGQSEHVPAVWLAGTGVVIAVAVALVHFGRAKGVELDFVSSHPPDSLPPETK